MQRELAMSYQYCQAVMKKFEAGFRVIFLVQFCMMPNILCCMIRSLLEDYNSTHRCFENSYVVSHMKA